MVHACRVPSLSALKVVSTAAVGDARPNIARQADPPHLSARVGSDWSHMETSGGVSSGKWQTRSKEESVRLVRA